MFRLIGRLVAVLSIVVLVFLAIAVPLATAWAQTTPATLVSGGDLWQFTMPWINMIASIALFALLTLIVKKAHDWFNVQIDQKAIDTFHSAAESGVNLWLSRLGATVTPLTFDSKNAVINGAVNYILTGGAADAAKRLGITPVKIEQLVEAKLGAMLADKTNAVTIAPPVSATEPIVQPPAIVAVPVQAVAVVEAAAPAPPQPSPMLGALAAGTAGG